MKFEDAIEKSIKAFIVNKQIPEKLNELKEGGIKYTPEYFDEFVEELAASKEKPSKKSKKESDDGDV